MNDNNSTGPTTPHPHQYYVGLLAPYALDALDSDQRDEVAAHVDGCSLCAAELAEMLDTAAVVALSESEPPPTQLWARIAADLNDDTAGQAIAGTTTAVLNPTSDGAPTLDGGPTPVVDLSQRRSFRRRPPRPLAALLGAAAALALAVPITRLSIERSAKTPTVRQLAEEQERQPGSRRIDLMATDGVSRVGDVVLTADGRAYIRLDDAERLPDDRTYQLWTIVDGKPVSAGLLGPSPTVAAFLVSPNAAAVALSVEQAAGASTPETGPIAVAVL